MGLVQPRPLRGVDVQNVNSVQIDIGQQTRGRVLDDDNLTVRGGDVPGKCGAAPSGIEAHDHDIAHRSGREQVAELGDVLEQKRDMPWLTRFEQPVERGRPCRRQAQMVTPTDEFVLEVQPRIVDVRERRQHFPYRAGTICHRQAGSAARAAPMRRNWTGADPSANSFCLACRK